MGIGVKMCLGKGVEKDGGRKNLVLLSDIFEVIIGVYFLDLNLMKVKFFIKRFFEFVVDNIILFNYGDNL